MEKLILFTKIIAWIFGILSTIFFGITLYMSTVYPGSVDEMLDKIKGVKAVYPYGRWFIIAIICWAFIIVF